MIVGMQCGKSIEINECNAVDIRKTSNDKWMLYMVVDDWSIGILDNLDEAAKALDSLKLFIGIGQDWDFNQYIKGQLTDSPR